MGSIGFASQSGSNKIIHTIPKYTEEELGCHVSNLGISIHGNHKNIPLTLKQRKYLATLSEDNLISFLKSAVSEAIVRANHQ